MLGLHKEFNDLGKLHTEHEKKLKEQENLCRYLQQKATLWHTVFEEHQKLRAQQQQALIETIEQKRLVQQQYIAEELTRKVVIPQALEEAQSKLVTYFSTDQHTQNYMTQLLDFMRRQHV